MDNLSFEFFGNEITKIIINGAKSVMGTPANSGMVASILVCLLFVFGMLFLFSKGRQLSAIKELDVKVREFATIEQFAEGYGDLQNQLKQDFRRKGPREATWEAWDEFNETLVPDDIDGPLRMRNSIRPTAFLNVEDLGFGPGYFRILPNLFVSVGLFFTFLGLVAALDQLGNNMQAGNSMEDSMQEFMGIASAKFLVSLTGLFCSILFTVLLRRGQLSLDNGLHRLCIGIERRLVFVSLEDIGFRQLRAATEQREHLREIGMGMVAELQKPLEALPERITGAIADKMDPIFERVSSMGTSNMEGLVGDLSSQLSHSVGNALTRASESLGEATARMGHMVDRMGATNAEAGSGLKEALEQMSRAVAEMRDEVSNSGKTATDTMNEGAEKLLGVMNDTLSGIRENTGQGANAMRKAADDMRNAAEGFRQALATASEEGSEAARARMAQSSAEAGEAIEGAGRALLDSFAATSSDIAKLGTEMGTVIGDNLLSQLEGVGDQLERLSNAIQSGTSGAQSAASGMNKSAVALEGASDTFRSASQSLVAATEPVRASHERIETAIRRVGEVVDTVSGNLTRNSASVAENAKHVLETAQVALGNEREGIQRSLEATRAAMAQLTEEAENLDKIDEMLGRALAQYNEQLEAALGTAQDHIGQMRDALAPGLDTLKSVVEQAESFMPAQRRDRQ